MTSQFRQKIPIRFKVIAIVVIFLFAGCSQLQLPRQFEEQENIRKAFAIGTKIDELNLSGLSMKEGRDLFNQWIKDKLAEKRLLVYNNTEVPITLEELGINISVEATWSEIEENPGQQLTAILTIDEDTFKDLVQTKLKSITIKPQNASYKIMNNQMQIIPGQKGVIVDRDKLSTYFREHSLGTIPLRIDIPILEVEPAVTTESMNELAFDGVIGEFKTRFAVSEKNRTNNLTLAAKAIDKALLKPGETFSFNKQVGPRTLEKGYKEAYIILEGEFIKDIGGGICQVSSTLYNAVLAADLEVLERSPHGLAINYVSLGQDATVGNPGPDFKFRNNSKHYVYLSTKVKSGELTVRLYGKQTDKKVKIKREIVKVSPYTTIWKTDPELEPGKVIQEQPGSNGYRVKVWKIIEMADGTAKETFLGEDHYFPAKRILRVGID